jgi:adenine-specific DNA-methyltransferase
MVARRDDFPKIIIKQTREFPIPEKIDADVQDHLRKLTEQILAAKKQLNAAQIDKDKEFYENKCASLDRQIDALVYELYGLTAEEIRIVEGTTA